MELKEIRTTKTKYNQKEFSNFLGVPYTTYRNYEKGSRKAPVDLFIKISNLLNIPLNQMFKTGKEVEELDVEQQQIMELVKKLPKEDLQKVYGYLLGLIDARG